MVEYVIQTQMGVKNMKKSIHKNIRTAVIPIAGILIAVLALLFYKELTVPKYMEVKVKTYSYSSKGGIGYKVMLKPNLLYSASSLEEGGTYIAEFVDSVHASFKYDFEGSGQADLKGSYIIGAVLEGYQEKQDEYIGGTSAVEEGNKTDKTESKAIWKKEYQLAPETKFDLTDNRMSISRDISINYSEYNRFAQQVLDAAKVNTPVRLVVSMNLMLQADTGRGEIEDTAVQSMVIPMGASLFNITKSEMSEKPGAVEKTQKVKLPVNRSFLVLYGAAAGILVIGLLYIIFFTAVKPDISLQQKELNKIFKKYGSRLAALTCPVIAEPGSSRTVKSMDDLVRIAEEIQKPVLYGYDSDTNCISRFFTIDGSWMYLYDLKEFAGDEETEIRPAALHTTNADGHMEMET